MRGIVPARLEGMTIYEAIKETIKEAMKARDQRTLDFARVVKAEMDRKGDGKPLPDAEAVKVLRALREIALEQGNAFEVAFLDRFLPQEMTEEEIEAWIRENLDLSQFKNPLAAIGAVTKALGPRAPGEKVRRVIERLAS
ncbi:GatB/YqeY domain-containing protein [Thermus brockianus]|jgi:uncharacterized protein YqeY|uniref:Yqey-like protein n=2 Tax=Thermus brockianus TaxID=56956 RepID=A0ABN6NF69_THEBO|nr:hypothetical protein TbrSNM41_10220 [Thermus brockianus]